MGKIIQISELDEFVCLLIVDCAALVNHGAIAWTLMFSMLLHLFS
jgi:hypothetical protein